MKFQVGDRVLVLHSNEEGEVAEILSESMVLVDVRGVRFPAYADQLDFPYFKRFTEGKPAREKKPKSYIEQWPTEKGGRVAGVATGVWLSFLPVYGSGDPGEEAPESMKIHLVNNSQQGYRFTYRVLYFGHPEFELENEVLVLQDFYLHDLDFSDLNDSPLFFFDFKLTKPDSKKAEHFEASLKLKPKQVFDRLEEMNRLGEATFSYKLFDLYPERTEPVFSEWDPPAAPGQGPYDAKQAKKHLPPAPREIDLHIERLTEDWQSLPALEILGIQLQALDKAIDLVIAHRQPALTVIHGIGKGKLRDEIHEVLRLKKEVKSFINQYDPRYGYGATEIYFQY
jgi:hypothetical protein